MARSELLKLAREVHEERQAEELERLNSAPRYQPRVTTRTAGRGTSPIARRRALSPAEGGPKAKPRATLGGREGKLSNRHHSPKAQSPTEVERLKDFVSNRASRRQEQMNDANIFRRIKDGTFDPGTRFQFESQEYPISARHFEEVFNY